MNEAVVAFGRPSLLAELLGESFRPKPVGVRVPPTPNPAARTRSASLPRGKSWTTIVPSNISARVRGLERGDADLLVLPRNLMSKDHPVETLYEEAFVCVVWAGSSLAKGQLSRERYLSAGHIVMKPQATTDAGSHEDWFVKRQGVGRNVAATSYGFATVPALLVGTDFIATMHERLAMLLVDVWPLTVRPCPIDIPPMTQAMQWHSYRTQDPGLEWLRGLVHKAAMGLTTTPVAVAP